MSVQIESSTLMDQVEEQSVDLKSNVKKFRKTRDYFGKRKFNVLTSMTGETAAAKLGYDEDSNDSGVSTRDVTPAGSIKEEPSSPSTASVTSESSSTASGPVNAHRAKVLRLEEAPLKDTSVQNILRGPTASSTPMISNKPRGRLSIEGTPQVRRKKEKSVEVSQQQRNLDEIKRGKWESDLMKVISLIQNTTIPREVKKDKAKVIDSPSSSSPMNNRSVTVSSSKRRIIPKQRISV